MILCRFIEAPAFTRHVHAYLDDGEYAALQWALVLRPDAGALIRGSGGLRKLRWKARGRGKSGGYRVIYYWRARQGEIWLLTIYAKNEEQTIPGHILRAIKEAMESDA